MHVDQKLFGTWQMVGPFGDWNVTMFKVTCNSSTKKPSAFFSITHIDFLHFHHTIVMLHYICSTVMSGRQQIICYSCVWTLDHHQHDNAGVGSTLIHHLKLEAAACK